MGGGWEIICLTTEPVGQIVVRNLTTACTTFGMLQDQFISCGAHSCLKLQIQGKLFYITGAHMWHTIFMYIVNNKLDMFGFYFAEYSILQSAWKPKVRATANWQKKAEPYVVYFQTFGASKECMVQTDVEWIQFSGMFIWGLVSKLFIRKPWLTPHAPVSQALNLLRPKGQVICLFFCLFSDCL